MSTKPHPEDYETRAQYRWALRNWRKRTGGYLWTTVILALIVGGLTRSTVLTVVIVFVALALHIAVRRLR
jgi:hypothetical protein